MGLRTLTKCLSFVPASSSPLTCTRRISVHTCITRTLADRLVPPHAMASGPAQLRNNAVMVAVWAKLACSAALSILLSAYFACTSGSHRLPSVDTKVRAHLVGTAAICAREVIGYLPPPPHPHFLQGSHAAKAYQGRIFTTQELAQYVGADGGPIYLAILGKVRAMRVLFSACVTLASIPPSRRKKNPHILIEYT
jgi:hypothetical protein